MQKIAKEQQSAASEDLVEGLKVVEDRSTSLKSFIKSFGQLSRLSAPEKQPVAIAKLVATVVPQSRKGSRLCGQK